MPFAILLLLFAPFADASRVRTVDVQKDQIVTVKTAIGVATIIQVPDRPTSLVVGDSEAFKIEYLDQAITIKPVRSNAKSNLYIYTDWRRFSVQLVTSVEANADYIVYLRGKQEKPTPTDVIEWTNVALGAESDGLKMSVGRIGRLKKDYLFVEFQIKGRGDVDPKWFWLTQSGKSKSIHRLALSSLSLNQDGHLEGLLQVRLKDLNTRDSIQLEVRRKKNLILKVPKEVLWR
ncbi:MAG: TrbG/VirB9 family P-type conjugative transfer protein [Bdellovibrionales bacterium]|nr:TrbG/VirB9 family P-type conjugative transfer protein [Bdellovibrionales bacterium]